MKPTSEQITSFYDAHSERLLRDFIRGNPRVSAATNLVSRTLSGRSGRILDVGCGIGTTSYNYISRLPNFSVDGVDISPKSIEIAKRLFECERLKFSESDMSQTIDDLAYDAIALIDVYEHIPCDQRSSFNRTLADSLSPNGTLILTAPSVLHQEYLQEHEPSGLQIVDEFVDFHTIQELAKDIQGTVTYFAFVDVWRTNQYLHVVIERDPSYVVPQRLNTRNKSFSRKMSQLLQHLSNKRLEKSTTERERLVREKLGINLEF